MSPLHDLFLLGAGLDVYGHGVCGRVACCIFGSHCYGIVLAAGEGKIRDCPISCP